MAEIDVVDCCRGKPLKTDLGVDSSTGGGSSGGGSSDGGSSGGGSSGGGAQAVAALAVVALAVAPGKWLRNHFILRRACC